MFKIEFGMKFEPDTSFFEYGDDWPDYIIELEDYFKNENYLLDVHIGPIHTDLGFNSDISTYWENILRSVQVLDRFGEADIFFAESELWYKFFVKGDKVLIKYKDWEKKWEELVDKDHFHNVWLGMIDEIHKQALEMGYLNPDSAMDYLENNYGELKWFASKEDRDHIVARLCQPILEFKKNLSNGNM